MRTQITQAQVDHPATVAAMLWVGIAGAFSTVIMPLIVGAASLALQLPLGAASSVAASEMGGVAAGSFAASLLVARANRSRLVLAAALLGVLANVASAGASALPVLLGSRFATGVAGGIMLATMAAGVGATTQAERNFGIFVASAFLLATAAFRALPPLIATHGASALFGILGAACAIAAAAALRFPAAAPAAANGAGAVASTGSAPASRAAPAVPLALGGILAYYLGVGAVWPLMERIGVERGVASADAAGTLALASIAAMCGALLAAALGRRLGQRAVIALGLSLVVIALAWLAGTRDADTFGMAPVLLLGAWNFTVPFLMGALAQLDPSGRAVAFNMTLQYVGFAIGPLIAALLVERGSLDRVIWFAAAGVAVSLALFVVALAAARRSAAAGRDSVVG